MNFRTSTRVGGTKHQDAECVADEAGQDQQEAAREDQAAVDEFVGRHPLAVDLLAQAL